MFSPVNTFKERFGPIRYFMAPMAGITDVVFRRFIRELGAQIVISELVSAEGLVRQGAKTLDLMQICEEERPVGIQLFGASVSSLTEAAFVAQEAGADFVDLNFGCPVKKVVCDGGGAAWLKSPVQMAVLLRHIRNRIKVPLSIKIRTGWDESSRNARDVVKVAAEEGVAWVAIHGRTRAQGYSGQADWELIREIAAESPIPIVGNGDLVTADGAQQKIDEGFAHAVMIGRGALKNPWIFQELLGIDSEEKNFLKLIRKHFEISLQYKGAQRSHLTLKKFMGWYAAGFPYSSQFRQRIFSTHDVDELWAQVAEFFGNVRIQEWKQSDQPFLQGGHG